MALSKDWSWYAFLFVLHVLPSVSCMTSSGPTETCNNWYSMRICIDILRNLCSAAAGQHSSWQEDSSLQGAAAVLPWRAGSRSARRRCCRAVDLMRGTRLPDESLVAVPCGERALTAVEQPSYEDGAGIRARPALRGNSPGNQLR